MAAQSALAAASLAACSHADVMMPFGQLRPLALFLSTVASSGDRKSTSDNEALWPVWKYEKTIRDEYEVEIEEWQIEHAAWLAQKRKIEGNGKIGLPERRDSLAAIGKEPEKPLSPFLIAGDPTVEGLTKNWATARAALGLFTAEGGSFTGGHGMNEDNRLKTGAMLSELWDGLPIKRIRATDGVTILPGRRLAMHVMIQPDAASAFLSNRELQDQGLLSRILVARPKSMSGTRLYKEMAARIAGVITLVEDLHAPEISAEVMAGAITLADWYVNEALRLQQAGTFDPALIRAANLLGWLQAQPDQTARFREILRSGPNQTRIKAAAEEALAILKSHHWISEVSARPYIIKAEAP
jgi:hypothetical protein